MIQNVQILPRNEAYWQENEWKKLLSSAISSPIELLQLLEIDIDTLPYTIDVEQQFAQRVPIPFVERMQKGNPYDPLLLQILPLSEENQKVSGFVSDPLQEHEGASPGLLHKYNSRVLMMLATSCAINCRYCFRREFPYSKHNAGKAGWREAFSYIAEHSEINEVILSGGDPLMVKDSYLQEFVEQLEGIKHVKRLRIHTRLPLVIPQRVTQQLVEILSKTRLQSVVVMHINHPQEIDLSVKKAMHRLNSAGVTLLNQSVLLNNINDDVDTLARLSEALFDCNILPYYLHLLDRVSGVHHFEVTEQNAVQIMQDLQTKLAGFLVPKLVREQAGKSSKSLIDLNVNHSE
ncbi:MAG: EF-P beta-lysylation protein EpmB [Kangiellaceae bacterium]|nr:EF-P beta-lysylation protein EpmB [Kangiellaceae bacterium]